MSVKITEMWRLNVKAAVTNGWTSPPWTKQIIIWRNRTPKICCCIGMLLYLRVIGLQLGLCKPGRVFIFNNPSHDLLYDPTDKKKNEKQTTTAWIQSTLLRFSRVTLITRQPKYTSIRAATEIRTWKKKQFPKSKIQLINNSPLQPIWYTNCA